MKNLILCLLLIAAFPALSQADLELFPNPFDEEVFLKSTPECGDSVALQVFDLHGVEVFRHSLEVHAGDSLSFESKISTGIYILRYSEGGKTTTRKIVYSGNAAPAKLNLILSEDSLECSGNPFEVYPNPSKNGKFWLAQPDLELSYKYSVQNADGRLLWEESVQNRTSSKHLLDLSSHAGGVFFLRIISARGTETRKLMLLRQN